MPVALASTSTLLVKLVDYLVDSRIKTARISYIAHAGRNLPVEEFSYLRTAYYTAAV